jgi:hypothetical protein
MQYGMQTFGAVSQKDTDLCMYTNNSITQLAAAGHERVMRRHRSGPKCCTLSTHTCVASRPPGAEGQAVWGSAATW